MRLLFNLDRRESGFEGIQISIDAIAAVERRGPKEGCKIHLTSGKEFLVTNDYEELTQKLFNLNDSDEVTMFHNGQ